MKTKPIPETRAANGPMMGRWYEAVGGVGLEVSQDGQHWSVAGCIEKRKGRSKFFDIRVHPDQDHGYTLATHDSLDKAKADFLDRMGVELIVRVISREEAEQLAHEAGRKLLGHIQPPKP